MVSHGMPILQRLAQLPHQCTPIKTWQDGAWPSKWNACWCSKQTHQKTLPSTHCSHGCRWHYHKAVYSSTLQTHDRIRMPTIPRYDREPWPSCWESRAGRGHTEQRKESGRRDANQNVVAWSSESPEKPAPSRRTWCHKRKCRSRRGARLKPGRETSACAARRPRTGVHKCTAESVGNRK